MDPLTWAIIATAAMEAGAGIWKMAKGAKMEKQAIADRKRYINTMGSWANWQLRNQKQVVSSGLESMRQVDGPKIGDMSYSQSRNVGREQQQANLSSYFSTMQRATDPVREKNLMAKKFGLGG